MLTEPASTPVSVPELFAAQVARTPEAVAVSFEGRSMTYRELDEAANRLAHLVVAHGAAPGQCVALLFSRSLEAIVAKGYLDGYASRPPQVHDDGRPTRREPLEDAPAG